MDATRTVSMESIMERLSHLDNRYFPRVQQSSALLPLQRKSILRDLYSRDVPVFLERYGSLLTSEELKEFDILSDDYEISWHLNHLRSLINPTSTLLRRAEEALLVEKIRQEQQQLGVDERDWVGNERQEEEQEEEEEEEEDDDVEAVDHVPDDKGILVNEHSVEGTSLSADEMQDRMDDFRHVMQQKFLAGEDHQHFNYSSIDDDVTLPPWMITG